MDSEQSKRRDTASCSMMIIRRQYPKTDRKKVRKWNEEHVRKQVHLHQLTFVKGTSITNGTNNGTVNGVIKRDFSTGMVLRKRNKVNYAENETGRSKRASNTQLKEIIQESGSTSLRDEEMNISKSNDGPVSVQIKTTQGSSKKKLPSKMSTSVNDVEKWEPSGYINNYDLSGKTDNFFNNPAEKKLPNLFSSKLQESEDETDDEEGEMKPENQRLNDGDLNEEFPPSENNDSSLCQDSSSISINANDNYKQNQHQAGYYESSSDLFEDDDYEVEYDSYNKDNVKSKKEMKRERMWKLSTGRFVEKELFNLGNGLKSEHAIYSFILNIDDEVIRQHFSEVELNKIDSVSGPQVPEFSSDTSLKKIQEIIKDSMLGNKYEHEKNYDIDYIIFAIYVLAREIQNESLKNDNLEA
ncbi:hypothetical protein C1645_830669 [Glomus cerebriforme]|uniref:Uncharacterized protein n=1 Tax=Glomus cerebriforme TaxID=658196 RepID=A0A397SNJ9_9GLOM|nr:hypothetical protein C1645_830669 [Glomus cerebriforme]